jgi:hypothetical protein
MAYLATAAAPTGTLGTWTPTLTSSSGSVDITVRNARYSKIGQHVLCTFDVDVTRVSGSSGATIKLGGLPFTTITDTGYVGSVTFSYFAGMNVSIDYMGGTIINSSTSADLWYSTSQGKDLIKVTQNIITTGSRMVGIVNYLST